MRILVVLMAGVPLCLSAAEPGAEQARFFESRIRPLFIEHCVGCHGPVKQKGGLRLDDAEGVRRGGDSGAFVVPGQPAKSLLIQAVRHAEGVAAMPPSKKLNDHQVADLTRWVADGAVFPAAEARSGADSRHWAFVPPSRQSIPEVRERGWVQTPIDAFILARLESNGLRPAPEADAGSWLRRVTFDLTGLPPTPSELTEFLKDHSPAARARVVDRLLASSAYGERWGRHWLDVARYADSNGLDENIAYGTAWRYRDYVVRSLNTDKPFDQFIREQVAGDLLPRESADHDPLIATGFLSLGPKVLAEVDEKKMELDIVDEQLDTLGQAFMAITMGCARCHDHKFDPLSQEDYYALAGIFASTKTMEHFRKIARWHENPLPSTEVSARLARHQKEVDRVNMAIQALSAKTDADSQAELKKLRDELAALQKYAPEPPTALGVTEGTIADMPLLKRGNHLTPDRVVPRRFPTVLAGTSPVALPATGSGRKELADWLTRSDHPLTARVIVNRVWRWHFGQGIVRSVDNFGKLGENPSHPELLDWLALRFTDDGWSLKQLHRMIVLSATYAQSSTNPQSTAAGDSSGSIDPENRLLGHFPRRRLEAEALRDALLAVSGRLDRTPGGPAITHVKNREFLFDHTSKDGTTYESRRRSIYLPVIRNNLYDVFQLFDSTDAAVTKGDRATTTVATQALFFMNSPLVAECADALAGELLLLSDMAERLNGLYLRALGRQATSKERERAQTALRTLDQDLAPTMPNAGARERKCLALLCQAVLSSNEFSYLQ